MLHEKGKIHMTNQSLCHTVLLWLNEKRNKWNIQITFQMNDHYGTDVLSQYQQAANNLAKQQQLWELRTIKTRELGCRCSNGVRSPPTAQHPWTDELESFRYLGDETSVHHYAAHRRLRLLTRPRSFNISRNLLTLVFRTAFESILTSNNSSGYTSLTVKLKPKLSLLSAISVLILFSCLLCSEVSNVLNCALMLWSCLRLIWCF